tara:strand:+ start:1685 stop:1963 length:279 start_codon:yes stop_codon:yes gene_type:complete
MKYELIIEGRNFLVKFGWRRKKHGFYKTVRVEADDPDAAELKGVEFVRSDAEIRKLTRNSKDDPPTLHLDSWTELPEDASVDYMGGASWYPE